MKVTTKFFVVALILSLIFMVSAVVATDDISFDQSDLEATETDEMVEESLDEDIVSEDITEEDFEIYYWDSVSLLDEYDVLEYKYPDAATGNVNITVNGNPVYDHVIAEGDDVESFNLSRLGITEIGDYNIIGRYNTDLVFLNATVNVYFPIDDNLDDDVINYINIYDFPEKGSLIIYNGVNNYTFDVLEYDDIYIPLYSIGIDSKGKYELRLRFVSDNYDVMFKKANITVVHVGHMVAIFDQIRPDSELFMLVCLYNYTGKMTILIDGEECYSQFIDKQELYREDAYIEVGPSQLNKTLGYGKYNATVKIADGDKQTILNQKSFQINYIQVNDEFFETYLNKNQTENLEITLPYDCEGNLTVTYNGKTKKIESTTGHYNLEVNADELNEGENILVFNFTSANDKYPNITYEYKIYVEYSENVKVEGNLNITEGNSAVLTFNAPVSDDVLEVYLDGKSFANYTLNSGVATINLGNLNLGEHNVTMAYFSLDYSVFGVVFYNKTMVLTVHPRTGPIPVDPGLAISVSDIVQGAKATVTITTNVVFTGNVDVKIGSKNYVVNVVKGKGTLLVGGLAVGTYTATATFAETEYFTTSVKSVSFKVNKKSDVVKLTLNKVKVKKSAKKLVIKATLKINGKGVKGKTIKFKFYKKSYKAKTNKNGVAKVTVKKSVLKKLKVGKKITYKATYGKITKKVIVKVKK